MKLIRTNDQGFTLFEMMIAIAILAIILLGLMAATIRAFRLTQETDNKIDAINEVQTVLNLVRAAKGLGGTFPDNVVGAFPAGEYEREVDALPNQVITIIYEDEDANPLTVTVEIQYTTSLNHRIKGDGDDGKADMRVLQLSTLLGGY